MASPTTQSSRSAIFSASALAGFDQHRLGVQTTAVAPGARFRKRKATSPVPPATSSPGAGRARGQPVHHRILPDTVDAPDIRSFITSYLLATRERRRGPCRLFRPRARRGSRNGWSSRRRSWPGPWKCCLRGIALRGLRKPQTAAAGRKSALQPGRGYGKTAAEQKKPTMPELPEVETVRRGLLPVMEGAASSGTGEPRRAALALSATRWPSGCARAGAGAAAAVEIHPCRPVHRRTLLIHLGMSGRMLVPAHAGRFHHDHPAPQKHDRNGAGDGGRAPRHLQRRAPFRGVDLVKPQAQRRIRCWRHWGQAVGERLRRQLSTGLKGGVADQDGAAGPASGGGLGTSMSAVLFRARLHPPRWRAIWAGQAAALVPLIREVLAEAIEAKGIVPTRPRQRMAGLGYFNCSFASTTARASPAPRPAAPAPSRGSCNRGGPASARMPAVTCLSCRL